MVEQAHAAGEIVFLASGSPPMTVKEVTPGGWVTCVWFSSQCQEFRENTFAAELLSRKVLNPI